MVIFCNAKNTRDHISYQVLLHNHLLWYPYVAQVLCKLCCILARWPDCLPI